MFQKIIFFPFIRKTQYKDYPAEISIPNILFKPCNDKYNIFLKLNIACFRNSIPI